MIKQLSFLVVFLLLWIITPFVFANTLKDIQFPIQEQFDKIHLKFSKAIASEPVIEVDEGAINIYIASNSSSAKPSKTYKPANQHLVHSAVVIQSKNSIRIDIALNSLWNVQNQLTIERDDTNILLSIDRNSLIQSLKTSTSKTTPLQESEVRKRIQKDNLLTTPVVSTPSNQPITPLTINPFPESEDWLSFSITASITLLALLLILYLILYLYQKLSSNKIGGIGNLKIQVAATYHLGAKQKVVVLQIEDRFFACGITPQSINFLTEVGEAKDQAFLNDISITNGIQIEARSRFDELLAKAQEATPVHPPMPHSESTIAIQEEKQTIQPEKTEQESLFVQAPPKQEETLLSHDPAMDQFAKVLNKRLQKLKPLA